MEIRRSTLYVSLLAILALAASCDRRLEMQEASSQELSLRAASEGMTRGYVDGTPLSDKAATGLHSASPTSPRTIWLSAWHYRQSGGSEAYFTNEPFVLNGNGEDDGLWHHVPRLYWPAGGRLDFLGYSCGIPFPDSSVEWGGSRTTDCFYLTVDRQYTQDDILFSYTGGTWATLGLDSWVPMTFSHAQAWIEFVFRTTDPEFDNIVSVEELVIRDIYTSGVLKVEHPYGAAEGRWTYRFDERLDTPVDDNNGIYHQPVTSTPTYLDMLLPEQRMKDIAMFYRITGAEPLMEYDFELPSTDTWQMGKKYIYEITFAPRIIKVSLSVTDWDEGGTYTSYIPES